MNLPGGSLRRYELLTVRLASASVLKAYQLASIAEAAVGNVIRYEWYCHNLKGFHCEVNVEEPKARVNAPYTYMFQQLGTYFAVLRVTGDLGGDAEILGGGQRNLARIRVIVGK